MTEAEKLALRAHYLANMAASDKIDAPAVELVRWTTYDWAVQQVECLHEQGFPVILEPDETGYRRPGGVPEAQESQFALAAYVCTARYTMDPRWSAPPDENQARIIFEYSSEVLAGCVAALGYEAPPLPSFEVFRAGLGPGQQGWDAYAAVPMDQRREVEFACPVWPNIEVLWS